jgi:hypothetical protein
MAILPVQLESAGIVVTAACLNASRHSLILKADAQRPGCKAIWF